MHFPVHCRLDNERTCHEATYLRVSQVHYTYCPTDGCNQKMKAEFRRAIFQARASLLHVFGHYKYRGKKGQHISTEDGEYLLFGLLFYFSYHSVTILLSLIQSQPKVLLFQRNFLKLLRTSSEEIIKLTTNLLLYLFQGQINMI